MEEPEFDVYQTSKGPICISTEAHRRILDALKEGERPFGEVVDATGKAKSTVSIHLNRMVDQGLVASREDEEDRRRRFFRLTADHLIHASGRDGVSSDAPNVLDAQGLLANLSGKLGEAGLRTQPLFREVGRDTGETLRSTLAGETVEATLGNTAKYWSKWGLGDAEVRGDRVEVESTNWVHEGRIPAPELFQGLVEGVLPDATVSVEDDGSAFTVLVDA